MAFLPHAQHWRALAVLVAWLLLLARSGAFQTATDHAELGRQIYLDCTREDGKNDRPTNAHNNLGIADRDQNQMEEARREYEESLKIYRNLAQKDPETFLPYVAATLNDLGILDSDQNRMEEARKEYEESLNIYRNLAQKDPQAYLPEVAATLNNLGILYRDKNRMEWRRRGRNMGKRWRFTKPLRNNIRSSSRSMSSG
jgi:tetratricopeptide (TPR) repeat protein